MYLTYSRGVTPSPPCYVTKIEKSVKGESSLLSLESDLSLCELEVLKHSCVRSGAEVSCRCFPKSPPKLEKSFD
ncbi:hypothetical protein NEPAR06_2211 [Nematocida parisii]|uniref:Uncharacterized protein n=1 Tax=Nematocida parisii (strain ERTm3) TaxID=935791 RepID=I3EFI2_NEMP3|nr:hypothetical protein NEQG_02051 [Nematocida parisii ERTm3]KAI5130944.1 hypothetical protein NEPAR03_2243 [Nematocida parisii]KAI5130957.1 hypothetical protein NEPAR08_2273 [Nematocida parisii]KAI5144747.1 hypothetical protein NEPAR07_1242 [Nematocida parisii]KAI5144982.1 hypothetical protein NEPAR04_2296 [Nematocida parisii]